MNSFEAPIDFVLSYNLASVAQAKTVQAALAKLGFYPDRPEDIDGIFGPVSKNSLAAYAEHFGLPDRQIFIGSAGCPWTVYSDGKDLCARAVWATCFGSYADAKQDNGVCASGYRLKDNPNAQVVALPMSYTPACAGSPWGQRFPWGTPVFVALAENNKSYPGLLEDVGPSRGTGNAVDVSEGLGRNLQGPGFRPNSFKRVVHVRIPGGLALRK